MELDQCRGSTREEWRGTHARLLPIQPWMGRSPKSNGSARMLRWAADSGLFVEKSAVPGRIPTEENVDWVVMSIAKNA